MRNKKLTWKELQAIMQEIAAPTCKDCGREYDLNPTTEEWERHCKCGRKVAKTGAGIGEDD